MTPSPQTCLPAWPWLLCTGCTGCLLSPTRAARWSPVRLQMAEILMEKLPGVYSKYFLKEGVVHAMDQLAATAGGAAAPAAGEPQQDGGGAEAGVAPHWRSSFGRPASRSADRDAADGAEAAGQQQEQQQHRTPAGDTLRVAVRARARRFKALYFTDAAGNMLGCDTEGVKLLADISNRLTDGPAAAAALLEALASTGNNAVSTFELLSSGLATALRAFLQGQDLPEGPARPLQLLERLDAFTHVALAEGSGGSPPMEVLVSKLLGALAASEKFAVQLNPITPGPSLAQMMYGYRASSLPRECARVPSLPEMLGAVQPLRRVRASKVMLSSLTHCPPPRPPKLTVPAILPNLLQAPHQWPAAASARGLRPWATRSRSG